MKKLYTITLLMLVSVIAFSQCIDGNCKNGKGTFIYNSGLKYEGEFLEGVRHGSGTLTYTDGTTYTGNFKYDKAHGFGSRTFLDGGYAEGEWKNDLMHGNGFFLTSVGVRYEGYFLKGIIKFGIKTILDKEQTIRFIGTFQYTSDAPITNQNRDFSLYGDGYGARFIQSNESSFAYILGEFQYSQPDGEAIYFETGGFSKMGIWKEGEFIETWLIKHQNKSVVYDTECISGDCINGFGIKTYSPGHKYIGEFKNGKQHGSGMLIRQSGMLCYTDFNEGNMNGSSSIIIFANGSIYEGEIIDNRMVEGGKWYKYDE